MTATEPRGAAFAACGTARAHLIMGVLVTFGTGSFLALNFGVLNGLPTPAWLDQSIRIVSIGSYVLALLVSVMGLLSILIGGIGGCGEITLGGRRLRNSVVGLVFLGVFALPWVTLLALYWRPR